MKYLAFGLFAATIPAANWMIGNVGDCSAGPCVIPIGFGLYAPSGVLMIGAALVLRDWLQSLAGLRWSLAAVLVGAALSLAVSPPAIALASALAFLIAETADTLVYSKLRQRGAAIAVAFSGVVGAFIDSAMFVWVAFGAFDLALGTALAKVYASALVAMILWAAALRAKMAEGEDTP
jgi:uncharacterized PurR-regulated membrane protein YhhQ (DUF165 family)